MIEPVQKAYKQLSALSANETFKQRYEERKRYLKDVNSIRRDGEYQAVIRMLSMYLKSISLSIEPFLAKLQGLKLEELYVLHEELLTLPSEGITEKLEKL